GSLVPALDRRELPRHRAVRAARPPVPPVADRVHAHGPHGPGQQAAHDRAERGNRPSSHLHPIAVVSPGGCPGTALPPGHSTESSRRLLFASSTSSSPPPERMVLVAYSVKPLSSP